MKNDSAIGQLRTAVEPREHLRFQADCFFQTSTAVMHGSTSYRIDPPQLFVHFVQGCGHARVSRSRFMALTTPGASG
jgi:hypothetical protein